MHPSARTCTSPCSSPAQLAGPPAAAVDAEADMFQTELDFGTMDAESFTRDVYQRCAACPELAGFGMRPALWRRQRHWIKQMDV